jgi:methylated-DNA-[protein]-cysteine S-methyltransferase
MATDFQQRVWDALTKIPQGRVTTYALLAKYLQTGAVRAVGTAVGKNPNPPKVPCHRVVRSDGSIGKYSTGKGTPTKIALLKAEGLRIEDEKIFFTEKNLHTF